MWLIRFNSIFIFLCARVCLRVKGTILRVYLCEIYYIDLSVRSFYCTFLYYSNHENWTFPFFWNSSENQKSWERKCITPRRIRIPSWDNILNEIMSTTEQILGSPLGKTELRWLLIDFYVKHEITWNNVKNTKHNFKVVFVDMQRNNMKNYIRHTQWSSG